MAECQQFPAYMRRFADMNGIFSAMMISDAARFVQNSIPINQTSIRNKDRKKNIGKPVLYSSYFLEDMFSHFVNSIQATAREKAA